MKSGSRTHVLMIGLAMIITIGAAMPSHAQNREKYLISATAGGINYVDGNVTVLRAKTNRQESLTDADNLKSGDLVTTGFGGRIEVLLNPGTYLRVAENAEFELTDASLDNLLVKLNKGSAVVEVTGPDRTVLAIGFRTPQTSVLIIKAGIYRLNALANNTTELLVRKGRLFYGGGLRSELKGDQKVTISGDRTEVAKVDKKDLDSLDLWSKTRAELLAKANSRLQRRPLLTAFNDFGWNDFNRGGLSWGETGLWVYSPTTRSHCYLPFGGGHTSPYGHRFDTGIWPGRGDGGGWRNRDGHNPGNGGGSTGDGGGSTSGNTGGNTGSNPSQPSQPVSQPPSQPSYQPPPQPPAPPPVSAPVEHGPRREYTTQSPN